MSEKMVKLLERQIDLQEEQNELLREHTQLLGELLGAIDALASREPIVNVAPGATNLSAHHTSVKNILAEGKKERGPAPLPDALLMTRVLDGVSGTPEVNHFWPTGKANPGWVRVSVKHPDEQSLQDRIAKGCLCGKPIVLKEVNGDKFHSCEALTQKGSCPYRPAAYFDKMTFLCNLPPQK